MADTRQTRATVKAVRQPPRSIRRIPFVTTSPFTDVKLLILLLPLWWLLGIEQFVGPILLTVALVKLALVHPYIRPTLLLGLLGLFLMAQLVSALRIDEPFRILTFLRTWGTYFTAAAVLVITTALARDWRAVRELLGAVVHSASVAAFIGFLGITGVWRPEVRTLTGMLLPEGIAATGYGEAIVHRQIGAISWFSWFGDYFRVDSLFMFSTLYAAALAIVIPIALYLLRVAHGRNRFLYFGAVMILVANLAFTTGRMAMLALLLGGAYWLVHFRSRFIQVIVLIAGVAIATVAATVISPGELAPIVERAVFARGEGSAMSRLTIYEQTLQGVAERPIIGWGTERDIPNFPYPSGSHSYYLGVLYKHGILGFALFVGVIVALWRATSQRGLTPLVAGGSGREMAAFLRYARWSLVTALLVGFTSVLDLDATVMLMLWAVLSCALATRILLTRFPLVQGLTERAGL